MIPLATARRAGLMGPGHIQRLGASLRTDAPQGLTAAQMLLGRQNLGALGSGAVARPEPAPVLTAADLGRLQVGTAATDATWTLPAAAGGGVVAVRCATATILTLQRAGSDTVDGATSLTLFRGQECLLVADGGSAWRSFGLARRVQVARDVIASPVASASYTLPPGYAAFDVAFTGFVPGSLSDLAVRLSLDGGVTFKAGGADYNSLSTSARSVAGLAISSVNTSSATLTPWLTDSGAGHSGLGRFTLFPGSGSRWPTLQGSSGQANDTEHVVSQFKHVLTTYGRATDLQFLSGGAIAALTVTIEGLA